jgi:hypothetical protein
MKSYFSFETSSIDVNLHNLSQSQSEKIGKSYSFRAFLKVLRINQLTENAQQKMTISFQIQKQSF